MIETYREKLDELWNLNSDLKARLSTKENIEEKVKDMLLHSSISFEDCEKVFNILTLEERL